MGDIDISFTYNELGIIIRAMGCQANYFRNALSAFKGTSQEKHYETSLAEVDDLRKALIHIYNNHSEE